MDTTSQGDKENNTVLYDGEWLFGDQRSRFSEWLRQGTDVRIIARLLELDGQLPEGVKPFLGFKRESEANRWDPHGYIPEEVEFGVYYDWFERCDYYESMTDPLVSVRVKYNRLGTALSHESTEEAEEALAWHCRQLGFSGSILRREALIERLRTWGYVDMDYVTVLDRDSETMGPEDEPAIPCSKLGWVAERYHLGHG